jgi:mannose-6-phosphate isomerase-like protein (cupin superfamily)
MSIPNPQDSDLPLALQRVVRCLTADLEATEATRDRVRAGRVSDDLGYLDRLVHKPWGSEFRVYEDDLTDIWCLHIGADRRTSLHCHPRKRTAMLCVEGEGTLSTCTGVRYALAPGVVLQIEPGAYHRIAARSRTGLMLIEVETPKDKFDLLRLEDDYRRETESYEDERHAPLRLVDDDRAVAVPLALQPFVEQPLAGGRRARLRAQCSAGRYRFTVESGEQVRTASNLLFAIALEPRARTRRAVTVLDERISAAARTLYLTVRAV